MPEMAPKVLCKKLHYALSILLNLDNFVPKRYLPKGVGSAKTQNDPGTPEIAILHGMTQIDKSVLIS